MLEDDFNDCIKKAIRGLNLDEAQLAEKIGHPLEDLTACLRGKENTTLIHKIAPELGLKAERLLNLKNYSVSLTQPTAISTIVSPFGHVGVNAYILEGQESSIIFDTGTDAAKLKEKARNPTKILITHTHPDHYAGARHFPNCITLTPKALKPGSTEYFDKYTIECINVSGHYNPALAYRIHGLETPVVIVGDCIFAGSIGGMTLHHYVAGLERIRDNILSLPAETILFPGHGPATTVAQELALNPFF